MDQHVNHDEKPQIKKFFSLRGACSCGWEGPKRHGLTSEGMAQLDYLHHRIFSIEEEIKTYLAVSILETYDEYSEPSSIEIILE